MSGDHVGIPYDCSPPSTTCLLERRSRRPGPTDMTVAPTRTRGRPGDARGSGTPHGVRLVLQAGRRHRRRGGRRPLAVASWPA